MTKAEVEKICNKIRAEFDTCFDGISDDFIVSIVPDSYDDEDLWCEIEIKNKLHSNWYCCLSCKWSKEHGIEIERDDSGLEPISPAVIWRLMFFDAMHELWLLRDR